jgi:cytochrome c oxidase accessory protein FixG
MEEFIYDEEEYRDSIATVDKHGKRVWIYPKKPKGPFYNARTWLSWALLFFLFAMPWIKVGGEPLLLFNILERKFIIFGILFTPQDFHLFVLAFLTFVLFIILFTVVFGRLFCGWICPQTIFMEMVFRKIEYWIEGDASQQRRLDAAPWTRDKIIKKTAKQIIFFAIAVLVTNTFLAYIIGMDEVLKIIREPISQHFGGFIAMLIFSGAFYLVFSRLREQVCVTICPYGRLQSVMLDKNSIVIAYDHVRGEPRGKIKKQKNPVENIQEKVLGDCIDCKLCVHVCPTGIDIRNGTQLECVNCTACIDACDEVMEKVGRPKKLIRYDSATGIETGQRKIFTPRVIAYTTVLAVLIGIQAFLLGSRTDVEAIILRTPGMLYQEVSPTAVSNLYNYQIVNKTNQEYPLRFELTGIDGEIKMPSTVPTLKKEEMAKGVFFVEIPKDKLHGKKNKITIEIYSGDKLLDKVDTNFIGP